MMTLQMVVGKLWQRREGGREEEAGLWQTLHSQVAILRHLEATQVFVEKKNRSGAFRDQFSDIKTRDQLLPLVRISRRLLSIGCNRRKGLVLGS